MLNAHCWRCSRRVFWMVGQRTACRQMLRNVDFASSDWMASRCQWRSSRKYKTEAPNTVFKVSISQGLLRRLWLFVSLALTQSNRLDWESIEKSWAHRHIAVSCCAYRCQLVNGRKNMSAFIIPAWSVLWTTQRIRYMFGSAQADTPIWRDGIMNVHSEGFSSIFHTKLPLYSLACSLSGHVNIHHAHNGMPSRWTPWISIFRGSIKELVGNPCHHFRRKKCKL